MSDDLTHLFAEIIAEASSDDFSDLSADIDATEDDDTPFDEGFRRVLGIVEE